VETLATRSVRAHFALSGSVRSLRQPRELLYCGAEPRQPTMNNPATILLSADGLLPSQPQAPSTRGPGMVMPTMPAMPTMPVMPTVPALPTVPTLPAYTGTLLETPQPMPFDGGLPLGHHQWVNTVMETAPHLDEQGILQALGILDEALTSVRQKKAIDDLMANLNQSTAGWANLGTAESLRQQVQANQALLMQRLQMLRASSPPNTSGVQAGALGFPAAAVGAPGLTLPSPDGVALPNMTAALSTSSVLKALADTIGQQAACQAQHEWVRALANEIQLLKQVVAVQTEMRPQTDEVQLPAPTAEQSRIAAAFEDGMAYKNDKSWKVPPRQANSVQTLSTSLQLLSKEDPDKLIIVRRINKLGFKASRKLKQYFGEFGHVVRVLIAHSTCRDVKDEEGKVRQRPSSLGFVQMASAQAVRQALSLGTEQEVEGAAILVQKFERQQTHAVRTPTAKDKVPLNCDLPDVRKSDFLRQDTSKSNASTAASSSFQIDPDAASFWPQRLLVSQPA